MRDVLKSLVHQAQIHPDSLAFCDDRTTVNYGQMAGRVAHLANALANAPKTIAIFAPNCVSWVIADLALALSGKTMVPLPTFFSTDQLTHIIKDAGVDLILTHDDTDARGQDLGCETMKLSNDDAVLEFPKDLSLSETSSRVIYTSGTTGAPKGVRIGARQITASANGLLAASEATNTDRYLSVLPFSLLLEQIAAICVPVLAGASVTIEGTAAGAASQGDVAPLVQAFATHQPTVSVLVPQLLSAWVQGLIAMRLDAPESLRFVAVGGAPISPNVVESAWALGIPVHEGYGLSECCSVVSVNRPHDRIPNSAGKPIDGTHISIVEGEIVIQGPTVMDGYLGREGLKNDTWATGDMGEITPDGAVRVLGRKDNLIVTPNGRNINPEWVETLALDAPGVIAAKLALNTDLELVLHITTNPKASPAPGTQDHQDSQEKDIQKTVQACLSSIPEYAQPMHIQVA